MKSTNLFLMGMLCVLGLGVATLPKASAQYGQPHPQEPAKEQPQEESTGEKPAAANAETKIKEAIKEIAPDANISSVKKGKELGTNFLYAVQFTSKGKSMKAQAVDDGTVLEIEEPADIQSFPPGANGAVRKAITQVGVRDNGVRMGTIYAEIQKDAVGEPTVSKLASPLTTYRADVQNSKGVPGKYSFTADGALLEKPEWAAQ